MSRSSVTPFRRPVQQAAFLALGCVGFIASAPALAAEPNADSAEEQARATIIVTGTRDDDNNAKIVAPLLNTPRSVVVVDKQVIKDTGSATLVDALRTVPGITFGAAEGGNPIGDRPFIRGFDSQGSTFIDSIRDTSAQSREVFAIEQIQIVRGSDSTLGGRGGAGGSINIVSKFPRNRTFVEVAASYGTADYKRLTGDVNVKLSDMVAVRVAGVWHDQKVAGRDALFQNRWGIAPSIKIGGQGPTSLTLGYYHLTSHELPDSGFPYQRTTANAPLGFSTSEPAIGQFTTISGATVNIPRTAFYGVVARDFRDTNTDQITLRVEHDFGAITLRNTSRFSNSDQAYIYTQPDDSQGNVYGTNAANPATAGGYVWRRANTRYGYVSTLTNQTDLFGTFETGSLKHSFAAGFELSLEKARRGIFVTRGYVNPTSGIEILSTGALISPRCTTAALARYYCTTLGNPNPNDPYVNYASDTSTVVAPTSRNLAITETQNDANTVSAYAFDSITITPSLIVNLGARVDRFKSTTIAGQPITATVPVTNDRTDTLFNWQAGVVFKPTANTSIYASYATSATPPNSLLGEGLEGNALPTTGTQASLDILNLLMVEKTRSFEVGAKADLFGSRLSLSIAAFRSDTDNARVTGADGNPQFIGKRRVNGIEVGFNGRILPGWTVFGGYTYLDATILDAGNTVFAVPAVVVGGVTVTPARSIIQPSVNTGRRFPQTAEHSATLWTDVEVTKAFTIGGGAFYTGRVFGTYADNRAVSGTGLAAVVNPATRIIARTIPGYWRFDARAGYKFSDRLEVSVNVQNLTDKTYFSVANNAHYALVAPGRSAFATLSVKY